MIRLESERLTLTPVSTDDYADLLTQWRDPGFTTPITGRTLSAEEIWFRLLRDIGHWSAVGYGNWTLRLKGGGDHVGGVGVLDYRRDLETPLDAPELGWGLVPRFQGQGLALEAVRTALAWCDEALKAPRTVCMIAPANAPSRILAARAGFRPYAEASYKTEPVILLERLRPAP